MDSEAYQKQKESYFKKLISFFETVWPSIYRNINGLFWGIISFVKDTLGGLWRRY